MTHFVLTISALMFFFIPCIVLSHSMVFFFRFLKTQNCKKHQPPDGRLPDADKGSRPKTIEHIRDVFYRMGFNDKEIVALLGAHAMGRCHTDRSGYWGPWTFAENTFSNEYFRLLTEERYVQYVRVTNNVSVQCTIYMLCTGPVVFVSTRFSLVWLFVCFVEQRIIMSLTRFSSFYIYHAGGAPRRRTMASRGRVPISLKMPRENS